MSTPGTARVRGFRGDCEMSDMADAGQGLSSETIGANRI